MYLQAWIDHMKIKNFHGIYAKDQLTTDMIKRNYFYIINLDDMYSPYNGTHWTAFYVDDDRIEYFDSYGLKPPQIISNYDYIYNSSQIQGYDSKACGYYCLFYIYLRSRHGYNFYEIIKQFSLVDLDYNQSLIKNFFNNYN